MKQQTFYAGAFAVLALFLRPVWCSQPYHAKVGEWTVEWTRNSLSVKAHAAPLAEIIQAVASRTGLTIYGSDLLNGKTDVRFSNLPLKAALVTLLPDVNYCLQEPSAINGFRFVLSVVPSPALDIAANMPAFVTDELNTATALPAYAGYIPEQYRYLYAAAKSADVEGLRQAATTGDATTQALAIKLLAHLDSAAATRVAAAVADSPDLNRRLNAIQSLGEMDNAEATLALGQALRDSDAGIRQSAVLGLHSQTSPDAIPLLAQALHDRDEAISMLALDFLLERGADGAAGIQEALQSDNPKLSNHARELLERLADAE